MSDYSFDERRRFGGIGEKMVIDNFVTILKPFVTEWIYGKYKEHTQKQRNGIDFSVNLDPANFEIKTRDYKYYKYNDILLETDSVIEKRVFGWIYTTKADVILYVWLDETKTKFIDGYIIIVDKLKKCLNDLIVEYWERTHGYSTTEGRYTTGWFTVPINGFPEGILIRFDPNELNKIYMIENKHSK